MVSHDMMVRYVTYDILYIQRKLYIFINEKLVFWGEQIEKNKTNEKKIPQPQNCTYNRRKIDNPLTQIYMTVHSSGLVQGLQLKNEGANYFDGPNSPILVR